MEQELLAILQKEKPETIFLVYGKSSFEASGAKIICDKVLLDYKVVSFSEFSPNPKKQEIDSGIEVYKKQKIDLVIAIGGGSTMDVAKAINGICSEGKVPLIAIPTTAGSGSEATHFAVFYDGKEKVSFAHDYILPTYVILDAQLTMSLPAYVTATTGLDALCQAIESEWARGATEESKQYAQEAKKLILPNIEKAVNNPDIESRKAMLEGANLAGRAINISKTTACHAMAYALTTDFGIAHGHAVALTMPQMLIFNNDDKKGSEEFTELMKKLGLKTKLIEFGITESDISALANQVSVERAANNPLPFGPAEAKKVLDAII